MEIESTKTFKEQLRLGEYAWPGGYPKYFICSDGEELHFGCAKANAREVMRAIANPSPMDTWRVIAVEINYEDELICSHCYKPIESAYGDND